MDKKGNNIGWHWNEDIRNKQKYLESELTKLHIEAAAADNLNQLELANKLDKVKNVSLSEVETLLCEGPFTEEECLKSLELFFHK